MPAYTETIIYIFSLIALGYLSVATKYLKPEIGDGMAGFVFNVAVPLLLFKNITKADFSQNNILMIWATYFGAMAFTWLIAHLTIQNIFGRDTRSGVVAGISAAFSNGVLIGLPFIDGVYGEFGVTILSKILTIHLPLAMAATIIMFEWAERRDGIAKGDIDAAKIFQDFLKKLFSNPIVIGITAGFVLKLLHFNPPNIAWMLIDSLGATVGPIALFSLGMAVKRYGIAGQMTPAITLVTFKLFLMPAAVLGLSMLFGLPELTTRILVSIAGLPVGVNSWLVAQQFGTGQRLAATSITIGTLTAIVTTSIWLVLCDLVFA